MEPEKQRKSDVLAHLRQQIQRLEGYSQNPSAKMSTGVSEIDQSLPGQSLALAAIHEFVTHSPEDGASASGFLSGLLSTISGANGVVLWIVKSLNIFPPSLSLFNLEPHRVIFIALPKPQEALWAMEEALRCRELVAVVCEVSDPDMTATRRMQIAAETSGVTGFLLRINPKKTGSTTSVTRWSVQSLPSELEDGLPGMGFPRWNVELLRVRNGIPGKWPIEWRNGAFHLISPKQKPERLVGRLAIAG